MQEADALHREKHACETMEQITVNFGAQKMEAYEVPRRVAQISDFGDFPMMPLFSPAYQWGPVSVCVCVRE